MNKIVPRFAGLDLDGPAPKKRILHFRSHAVMPPLKLMEQKCCFTDDFGGFKPNGLWVTVEGKDDWRQWCLSEKFRLINLRHIFEVKLKSDAAVLWVQNADELDSFSVRYKPVLSEEVMRRRGLTDDQVKAAMKFFGSSEMRRQRYMGIDWPSVAKEFQGIIIAPYIWDRRFDLLWYYGWDCASGCIWDPAAIASITLTKERGVDEKAIKREIHSRETPRRRKKLFERLKIWREEDDKRRGA